jgi:hypothetical protein
VDPRRAIVTVLWGPHAGRKAALSPGDVLRVGRGEMAGLVVPNDGAMSALHFEVAWDGARLAFRDNGSAGGVVCNGREGVTEGELKSGDWLKAGQTVFTLHVEGSTPPRPEREVNEGRRARAEEALSALQRVAAEEPLWAVLDAARDKRILELCRESVEEHRSLYEGLDGESLAHVAPYLVQLPAASRLLEALVREGWEKRWGIWITSRQSAREVRRHLRRFLMVEHAETGQGMYFRFYDPEVLRTFVGTCSERQRAELFGDLRRVLVEGEGGALVTLLDRTEASCSG